MFITETEIQCNKIIQLLNGEVSCNNKNLYNSQCTFSCNDGYRLVGNKLAVCKANKLFSSTPSCEGKFSTKTFTHKSSFIFNLRSRL